LATRPIQGGRKELVVLIKPTIIRNAEDWEAQTRDAVALDDMDATRARVIRMDGSVYNVEPAGTRHADVPGAFFAAGSPVFDHPGFGLFLPARQRAGGAQHPAGGAARRRGFLKVVGEVGCGKTVLCRQLLKTLQGECVTAYIPNPDMGPDDLLMALSLELSIKLTAPISRHSVLNALRDCLLTHALEGAAWWSALTKRRPSPAHGGEPAPAVQSGDRETQAVAAWFCWGNPNWMPNSPVRKSAS
jgi:hypothetical protein